MASLTIVALILASFTLNWSAFVQGKDITCSKGNLGRRKVYEKTNGDDGVLYCVKESGQFKWKFLDGSSTLGEMIDPAQDCSDIVDNVPDAKDGFYWITLGKGKIVKVWCDVHVDGGGLMLVGKLDGPLSLSAPSNATPVDPKGPSRWSSEIGSLNIQDFAVQISENNSFAGTRAYWMYKLKKERNFGNLFGVGKRIGCTDLHSGIGDVKYVKDILTQAVVTTKFSCSKFGPHTVAFLGWGRMNYCFGHECPRGYAFFPGLTSRYDSHGALSYSTSSSHSGITHNATAFVGCDNGKCCACYGPRGARGHYCAPKCKPINGGTVITKANVWFWVRTRMPTRIWKQCMEFKMKDKQGNVESFFIDKVTGSVHKGSCSGHFQAYLNEGTLSVLNEEGLKDLPSVPGLISYRKDNEELYVNNGNKWGALSKESEVERLQTELNQLKKTVKNMEVWKSCSAIKRNRPYISSGFYKINPRGYSSTPLNVYCDMSSKSGIGVTVIGHNSEQRTLVDGYESAGSYKRKVVYSKNIADLAALTRVSQHCEQFIKWECFAATFDDFRDSWWVSRQGAMMRYWGGATGHVGKCACALTNSCAGGNNCNCNKNDAVLRKDEGYLTDKNTLPVTELRFGDTEIGGGVDEYGYYTLGKLFCWR